MKNRYDVLPDGNTVRIWLQLRDGVQMFAYIDLSDLDVVSSVGGRRWYAFYKADIEGYYVKSDILLPSGRKHARYLHRVVMGCTPGDGMHVDHIDHDGLNNRRENLRVTSPQQNHQNYKSAYKNSKTGVRGVIWRKDSNKYQAVVKINYKQKSLGYFTTLEEAATVVSQYRREHMPYSVTDQ